MQRLYKIKRFSTISGYRQEIKYLSPTVYALSTAPAKSAIGVIRITGPASEKIFSNLTGSTKLPKHRVSTVKKIYDFKLEDKRNDKVRNKILLDECLILFFKSPNSYTGEDLLELHVHGGIAVINKVMDTISKLHSVNIPIRLAEAGEFSKRAFQNQKYDLTEVEGINTLIQAETETQRISALSSMKGETNILFKNWREQILKNIALLTTVIDFGEDHDIDEVNDLFKNVNSNIKKLEIEVKNYILKVRRSQILLDGIKVTLIGPPNAGKSSLLNILANEDKAIVSNIAGTTRDTMDIPLDVNGYKIIVGDTAGIRESKDIIEQEGVKRAKKKSLESDINILILPADNLNMTAEFFSHALKLIKQKDKECLIIVNKCDLINDKLRNNMISKIEKKLNISQANIVFISCIKNMGIKDLIDNLTLKFKQITFSDKANPITISARANDILINDVLYGFTEFHKFYELDDIVMASEGLKLSVKGIGKVTGEDIGMEEILGVVFSKFCIGK